MSQTLTKEAPFLSVEEIETSSIILFNDDVNTFEHVINCLIQYCKHTYEQAEQCAFIVHYCGKCSVKSGSINELAPICLSLLDNGLSVIIE